MNIISPDKSILQSDEPAFARALALVGLAVCEASGRLHVWSPVLLCLSFLVILLNGTNFLLSLPCLAAAACHSYFAWCLAFDRPVFASWARLSDDECPQAQRAFDIALGKLLNKDALAGASMSGRVMGARRLHLLQIASLIWQMLMLLVLMMISPGGFVHAV